MLSLGCAYLQSSRLARTAQHALDNLSRQLGESCSVATLDGDRILYIARAPVSRIITVELGRGSRLPAYATALGNVLLSELAPAALDGWFSRVALVPLTPYTITDEATLRARLRGIKKRGFAINDRQLEAGLRSMAVPMYASNGGGVVAAMNVGVDATRFSSQQLQARFLPALQRAAMELALQL